MLIGIIKDSGTIITGDYKKLFPRTSFPASGPDDEFLAQNNAKKVSLFKPFDRDTEKLVSCDPYVEGDFIYTVEVVDKTEEDFAAETASKAANLRAARDQALKASDWTQLADAPVDKEAWATYRQALRDLPDDENWPNVQLPNNPDWVDPSQP